MSEVVAVVPARGGSKGVRDKNLQEVGGRSLVRRALECGMAAKRVDHVVLSTDSSRVTAEAGGLAVEVLARPAELASDAATTGAVAQHAVRALAESGRMPRWLVVLQPTSPFRVPQDVDAAIGAVEAADADTCVSVGPACTHPYWARRIREGRLEPFLDSLPAVPRRQLLPPAYGLNGAIYVADAANLLETASLYGKRVIPYVMDKRSSIDIDDEADLWLARAVAAYEGEP